MIMNTAIPRVTGSDGKHYPIFQLTAGEREVLFDACHRLRHDSGLSIAAIQTWLEERGVERSRGAIHKLLVEPCERCPARGAGSIRTLRALQAPRE
jgi:hypothetical protein